MTPEHRKIIYVGFVLERVCVLSPLHFMSGFAVSWNVVTSTVKSVPPIYSFLVPLLQFNESGSIGYLLLEKSSLIIIKDWLCMMLFFLINFNTARNVVAASSLADTDFPLIFIFHSKLISNMCDYPIYELSALVPLISGDPFLKFLYSFFE